jgi:hypothetical protein
MATLEKIDTCEIMTAPKNADQKPSTVKLRLSWPATQAVAPSNAVLIISTNKPNVATIRQHETTIASGFSSIFTIAKMAAAATSDGRSPIWMPGTITLARNKPTRFTRNRTNRIDSDESLGSPDSNRYTRDLKLAVPS